MMTSPNRILLLAALAAPLVPIGAAQTADTHAPLDVGQQLRAEGRYAESEKVLAALRRATERSEPGSPFLATVLDNQALTEMDLGNYVEAESLMVRSLSICRKTTGPDSAGAASTETHLAELYIEERRPADAEPLLREAIDAMKSQPHPDRVALAVCRADLAMAYASERRLNEAERLLRDSSASVEAELGRDHPMVASTLIPLVGVLMAARRYADALEPAERAWRILQADSPHIADPDLAAALDTLSMVYARNGRAEEAEQYARRAVQMAESVYGPAHPHLAWYLNNYATILKQIHRSSEAKPLEKRARAILAQSSRDNPTQLTVSLNGLRSPAVHPIP